MNVYIYDGSFDGLLTLIYKSYHNRQSPNKIISSQEEQTDFLATYINIITDGEKAKKVYDAIIQKISYDALSNVYYAFLSEQPGCEMSIFNYIRLGFKIGKSIDDYLSKDIVLGIHDLSTKVNRERHAMLGLIRFVELDRGLLYAKFGPKYNVLSLVSPHFAKRLASEKWVIFDENRELASIFNGEEWYITEIKLQNDFEISDKEKLFQSLWKNYFDNISIKERKNLKLQQKNMPKRYWKYLTEKKLE